MRPTATVLALSLACVGAFAADSRPATLLASRPTADASDFLRTLTETRAFRLGHPKKPQITPDGRAILYLRSGPRDATQSLFEYDLTQRRERQLASATTLAGGDKTAAALSPEEQARRERMRVTTSGITSYQIANDGTTVLFALGNRLFLITRAAGAVIELPLPTGTVIDPQLSPDGRAVAYVRDHDVRLFDLKTRRESDVTLGGSEAVSHGLAEFVAEEEMGRHTGFWWAPQGEAIAYAEVDERPVETWWLSDPFRPERAPQGFRYPRPGRPNAEVGLFVARRDGGPPIHIVWDQRRYPYLGRVDWHEKGGLTLVVQTRDQKELALLSADPARGDTRPLLVERDPAWVNLDQDVPRWLADGSGFLWTTEAGGGPGLELRDAAGRPRRGLVSPDLGYRGLVSVDDQRREVFFHASLDPTEAQLFKVGLDGGAAVQLTSGRGVHDATFARDHSLFVDEAALADVVRRVLVCGRDGRVLDELPTEADIPTIVPRVEITRVGELGFVAALVRPRDFDPGRRYPVIVDVYGGPGQTVVSSAQRTHLENQWLADQGFIVVSLDGRGTPHRGRDWERALAGRLGTLPLEDQVAGLAALCGRYRELDSERVGVTGWSFGGYLTALAVLRRPDVFKAGVAGAPVCDWLDYDTHYTERYLGVPDLALPSTQGGYREASLLTYASDLTRPLLIVHGTADDNVYFRHTLKLADALHRAGREVTLLPLPGQTHLVNEPVVRESLARRSAEFFRRHLGEPR